MSLKLFLSRACVYLTITWNRLITCERVKGEKSFLPSFSLFARHCHLLPYFRSLFKSTTPPPLFSLPSLPCMTFSLPSPHLFPLFLRFPLSSSLSLGGRIPSRVPASHALTAWWKRGERIERRVCFIEVWLAKASWSTRFEERGIKSAV